MCLRKLHTLSKEYDCTSLDSHQHCKSVLFLHVLTNTCRFLCFGFQPFGHVSAPNLIVLIFTSLKMSEFERLLMCLLATCMCFWGKKKIWTSTLPIFECIIAGEGWCWVVSGLSPSDTLCLLNGAFSPFVFKMIVERYDFSAIVLTCRVGVSGDLVLCRVCCSGLLSSFFNLPLRGSP